MELALMTTHIVIVILAFLTVGGVHKLTSIFKYSRFADVLNYALIANVCFLGIRLISSMPLIGLAGSRTIITIGADVILYSLGFVMLVTAAKSLHNLPESKDQQLTQLSDALGYILTVLILLMIILIPVLHGFLNLIPIPDKPLIPFYEGYALASMACTAYVWYISTHGKGYIMRSMQIFIGLPAAAFFVFLVRIVANLSLFVISDQTTELVHNIIWLCGYGATLYQLIKYIRYDIKTSSL